MSVRDLIGWKNPKVYDFVGNALIFAFEDDAWDRIGEHLQFVDHDEYKKLLAAFTLCGMAPCRYSGTAAGHC